MKGGFDMHGFKRLVVGMVGLVWFLFSMGIHDMETKADKMKSRRLTQQCGFNDSIFHRNTLNQKAESSQCREKHGQ